MNAKAPEISTATRSPNVATGSVKDGNEALSLDFTRRPVAEILAQTAAKEAAEVPELLDYREWEPWFSGFVREIPSLPGMGQTLSAALTEFVKAQVAGNEWRPDVVTPLRRAYDKYSAHLESKGFPKVSKSEFVELFVKELRVIPAKLYKEYLNRDALEARAKNFRMVANANPGNSEIRKLRNLADTLALGRSQFAQNTSDKNPENPCVKLRNAVSELSAKIEGSVSKPAETSILATPVSELVSRALSGIGIGQKKKKQ